MNIGDLVKAKNPQTLRDPIARQLIDRQIGIVVQTGTGWDGQQVKVFWNEPTWFDVDTGLASEYPDRLEVISEAR